MNGQPQEQSKTQQAMHTATSAINLSRAVRNWNDAPANPIVGSSGGAPVGGQVGEAAGAAASAGEAAGTAAGVGELAELAPLALL